MKQATLLLLMIVFLLGTTQSAAQVSNKKTKKIGEYFANQHRQRLQALEENNARAYLDCFSERSYLFDIGVTLHGKREIGNHAENILKSMHIKNTKNEQKEVEIVKGSNTSDETVARAFDFIRHIKKIPIIIEDSLAFYTTRISRVYMLEAFTMLLEGQSAIAIEQAAKQAGMRYAPLMLADELGLPNILALEEKVVQLFGEEYKKLAGVEVVERMLNELQRKGKGQHAGFYDYTKEGKRQHIWADIHTPFPLAEKQISQNTMMERLLFIQCLEAVRCLDNGMIGTTAEANLGSIYGAGFADFKGGAIQYINGYGITEFTQRALELKEKYGWHFTPPDSLLEMAEKQVNFN